MTKTNNEGAILYHGTTGENVARILESGFKEGTYFAQHLEDAIRMGGDHVFEIWVTEKPTKCWEWICPEPISASRIVTLIDYSPKLVRCNKEMQTEIRADLLAQDNPGWTLCKTCQGRGQLEDYPPLVRSRDRDRCTACADCGGFGSPEKRDTLMDVRYIHGKGIVANGN